MFPTISDIAVRPYDAAVTDRETGRRKAIGDDERGRAMKRRMGLIVFDRVTMLDVSGPAEVLNKADRVKPDTIVEPADAILISARDGMGLETLKAEIARRIAAMRHRAELVIPYSKGNLLSMIHSSGQVLSEEYLAEGTKVDCLLDMALYQKIVNQLK